jgi:predicted negative regulator of RcsB-dependent stress response
MTEHLTEDEQVEKLKKWWKENGVAVITGIVIGLAGVVGVRYWFNYQEQQSVEASRLYSTYMTAVEKKDIGQANQDSQKLKKDYAGTSYAALAAMQQASQSVTEGNLEAAVSNLQWAVDNPGHDTIAHLARIRLANVLIVQNKYTEALQLIKDVYEPAFDARYAELRGDIYAGQDQKSQARSEYQSALASNDLTGKQREFVEMKLNDLGVVD